MAFNPTDRGLRQHLGGVALGTARLTMAWPVDEQAVAATIGAAVEAGITLVDTAIAYTPDPTRQSLGEHLVADALSRLGHRAGEVLVATKGGSRRISGTEWQLDGSPATLRASCDESLIALGVDIIGLYQLHWPDPAVPLSESVGTLHELRLAGKIRGVGLSNVTHAQLAEANTITRIDSVQNRFGPHATADRPLVDWCAEHDTTYLAWEPVGGSATATLGTTLPVLDEVGRRHGITAQQTALAWLTYLKAVPLVGSTRPATIRASMAATTVTLDDVDLDRLEEELRTVAVR